jgi:hypothetical protein
MNCIRLCLPPYSPGTNYLIAIEVVRFIMETYHFCLWHTDVPDLWTSL